MTKHLTIRELTREDFYEKFNPAEKHKKMHEFAKQNTAFIDMVMASKGGWALVDEDDYIYMMMGGQIVSHNTGEVWLAFGEGFETHVKSCIKALNVLIFEKIPPQIYRLEANVYIDDTQAINLLEKCLKFDIIGVRRKLGFRGEDVVLLERIL